MIETATVAVLLLAFVGLPAFHLWRSRRRERARQLERSAFIADLHARTPRSRPQRHRLSTRAAAEDVMADNTNVFAELPRLSATRFGPIPPNADSMRLYRDGPPYGADGEPSMLHQIRPENPYVDARTGERTIEYVVGEDRFVTFAAPRLTFACECARRAFEGGPSLARSRIAVFLKNTNLDVEPAYELQYPGELPHSPACFHRIFCRVAVPLDVALTTVAERITARVNDATDAMIDEEMRRG